MENASIGLTRRKYVQHVPKWIAQEAWLSSMQAKNGKKSKKHERLCWRNVLKAISSNLARATSDLTFRSSGSSKAALLPSAEFRR